MNNEFKKTSSRNQTVYTLESATAGGTSSSSIASTDGKNLIAQESDKKKIPSSTPRNFVAKNAKTGGAGAHKDKKKAEKQGTAKHKKPYMEDHEVSMASNELKSIHGDARKLLGLVQRYGENGDLQAWQQSKITKAADYLNSVLQSIGGEQGVAEGDDYDSDSFEKWKKQKDYEKEYNKKKPRDDSKSKDEKSNTDKKEQGVAEGKEDKIAQLKKDHDTAVHWSKNETSPQKREAARQKAEKIKGHLAKQYKQELAEGSVKELSMDLKSMPEKEFIAKYNKSKAEARDAMKSVAEVFSKDKETGTTHKGGVVTKTATGTKHTKTDYDDGHGEKGRKPSGEGPASRYAQTPILDKDDMDESVDSYFESLDQMLERQLEPTMDLDTWNNNFQNADPNKYHQFKNKTPEKKK